MAVHQVQTPGGPDECVEGNPDDEYSLWLQKYDISSNGIVKITSNSSFKKTKMLSKHHCSLAKEYVDALNLSVMDKVGFLDGIEDLRKQNSPPIQPQDVLHSLEKENMYKTQMIQNIICELDDKYKEQQQQIDQTFIDIISSLNERKSNIDMMLNKIYLYNKNRLNVELSHLSHLNMNDINELKKYSQLLFTENNKNDIIQSIQSFGSINPMMDIKLSIPSLKIKTTTYDSVEIVIVDQDITNKHHMFRYEIQCNKTAMDIDEMDWSTQLVIDSNNSNKQTFCIQNLETNQLYFIRIKKCNVLNNQCVISSIIKTHTLQKPETYNVSVKYNQSLRNKSIKLNIPSVPNDDAIEARKQLDDIDDLEENKENQMVKDSEQQLLCWDKIRRGLNVIFVNDYRVKTGGNVLVVCNSGISPSVYNEKEDFLWEIRIDKISMDSSFIGWVNGPITKQSKINWNRCLTGGKFESNNQFAVALNNNSSNIVLFGKYATKRKLKLKSTAKRGDKFMFHLNFKSKSVTLYQNDQKIDTIFTNISNYIIPAVSGRGGQYTIKTIYDLSVIDHRQKVNNRNWSWW